MSLGASDVIVFVITSDTYDTLLQHIGGALILWLFISVCAEDLVK